MKILWGEGGWTCPRCNSSHRVRGLHVARGSIRKCRCGFRIRVWGALRQYPEYVLTRVEAIDEK